MDWLGSGLAGDVLGAAGSVIGSIFGGNSASEEADKAYNRQRELMSLQNLYYNQNWDYQMLNKHQLEVRDLKAAGINPLISVGTGQSATPASLSAPSVAVANKAQSASALSNAFSQMFSSVMNAKAQMKNAEANANSSQANLINAQTNWERFKFDSGESFNLAKDYFSLEKSKVEPLVSGIKLDNAIKQIELEFAPKFKEKQMTKLETEIAMARLVGEAQAAHYIMTGNAALAGAAAQQSMAATAARLGVSQEQLNSQLGKKAQLEASKLWIDNWFKNREAGYLQELDDSSLYRSMKYGKGFAESIPLLGNLLDLGKGLLK